MCFQKKLRLPLLLPAPSVDWQINRLTPLFSIDRIIFRVPSARTFPLLPAPIVHSTTS